MNKRDLENVSAEILRELQYAIELLDDTMAYSVIAKIEKSNGDLGVKLSEMIQNIRHKEILSFLDSILDRQQYVTGR